jgi:hypothetical protein
MRPEGRIVFFAIRSAGHAARIAVGAAVAAIVIRTCPGTCASAGHIRFQWRQQRQQRDTACDAAQWFGSRSAVRSNAACAGKQHHAASADDTAEQ